MILIIPPSSAEVNTTWNVASTVWPGDMRSYVL